MISAGAQITELRPRRRWNPKAGWETVRRWRGLSPYINGLVADLQRSGVELDEDPEIDGPHVVVSGFFSNASDGGNVDDQIIDLWELIGNDLEKSILESERALAIPSAGLNNIINKAREVNDPAKADSYGIIEATFGGDHKELFIRLARGYPESFYEDQWVLRNTKVVDPQTSIRPSYVNVKRVFTSVATLIAKEKIPSGTFPFDIPPGQWLKRRPHAQQQSDGKWLITQEYWHADAWDTFVYKLAV